MSKLVIICAYKTHSGYVLKCVKTLQQCAKLVKRKLVFNLYINQTLRQSLVE